MTAVLILLGPSCRKKFPLLLLLQHNYTCIHTYIPLVDCLVRQLHDINNSVLLKCNKTRNITVNVLNARQNEYTPTPANAWVCSSSLVKIESLFVVSEILSDTIANFSLKRILLNSCDRSNIYKILIRRRHYVMITKYMNLIWFTLA